MQHAPSYLKIVLSIDNAKNLIFQYDTKIFGVIVDYKSGGARAHAHAQCPCPAACWAPFHHLST